MDRKCSVPQGVQDYLPSECRRKMALENGIMELFESKGYSPVETPVVEYMDVFTQGPGSFCQESMFKLSDDRGRLLALRPDMTTPVARMAATRLTGDEILRLCYSGPVFTFTPERPDGLKQVTQMGVELMGEKGAEADAEIIALAIELLRASGLKSFQIDIGQAEFFKGLVRETGLDADLKMQVCALVEQKDMFALEMLMQQCGVEGRLKNNILELPSLYGGVGILDRALGYSPNSMCRDSIQNLKEIAGILEGKGLGDYISIDLGLVQSVHYYTGMVFNGISEKLGYPLITGGRYDSLVAQYGRDMPATGFALKVHRLMAALEREGGRQ